MPLIESDSDEQDEALVKGEELMREFELMLEGANSKTAVTKGVPAFSGEWPTDDRDSDATRSDSSTWLRSRVTKS